MRIYTKILLKSTKKAHNRIWTGDLFLTKEVLYRLSYMGIECKHMDDSQKRQYIQPRFINIELLFCWMSIPMIERVAGIEPASSAWKAEVLPLYHTRVKLIWRGQDSNLRRQGQQIYSLPSLTAWVPLRNQFRYLSKSYQPMWSINMDVQVF